VRVLRNLQVTVVFAALMAAPAWCQDSTASTTSLGEIARQLRSQKNNAQPATVITNDDVGTHSPAGVLGIDTPNGTKSTPTSGANPSPEASLNRWESVVTQIAAIDQQKMVKLALQGSTADFPGRSSWESRLMTAKDAYVSDGRELISKGRELLAKAHTLENEHVDRSDPRAMEMETKLKDFITRAMKMDANFEAVILEGRDLARQAQTHTQ
jgi:hypothetical protein